MSSEIVNGLFALGGAIIGVLGSYFITKSTTKVFRLSIHKSPLAKLLDVGNLIKDEIEINYKGNPITGLFGGEVAIQNIGNQSIKDINFQIISLEASPIIDFEINHANFSIDKNIKPLIEQNAITITIPFLNPKDKIIYSYKIAGVGKAPEIIARQQDVNIDIRDEMTTWIPDIYAEAIYESFAKDLIARTILAATTKPFRLYLESKKSNKT